MSKIFFIVFVFICLSSNSFAKIEKWECYAPKNSSKFADKTVVGTYKLDTDKVTVEYFSNGNWKYYDWCCNIKFNKERNILYFSFLGFNHIFDLNSKDRFVSNFKYPCKVIN